MRAAARLLASVKPGKFLEPGAPTGLTGLFTHASPRSALLYHYNSTLDKLKQVPESSVYRQSTEALTKHRLQIIEQSKPAGWDEWQDKVRSQLGDDIDLAKEMKEGAGWTAFVMQSNQEVDERWKRAEWDGETAKSFPEGIRSREERLPYYKKWAGEQDYSNERRIKQVKTDPEPQYTADQISDLESKFGAGLLEEVIEVAEGEHTLVDTMVKNKVWEPLEEQAPAGQWSYFERATHTNTQQP